MNLYYNFINIAINSTINITFGNFFNDLSFFVFELFFIFSILALLVSFVIISNKKLQRGYLNTSLSFVKLLIFVTALLLLILNNNLDFNYYIFNGFYFSDYSSLFFKNLIIIFFCFFIFLFLNYLEFHKNYDFEFLVVLFLSLFSSVLIINSNDLLSLFFIIELQSLSFYIIVASKQTSSFSTEAALKYFVLGSFSSGVILFGISLIYGFTGLLSFDDLSLYSSAFANSLTYENVSIPLTGLIVGLMFLTVGLLFKVGAVPFHM